MSESRTPSAPDPLARFSFVPATRAISVGRGVVYRPLRSWHSGVFAGERLPSDRGDRSGCVLGQLRGLDVTVPPKTYTHRLYWNSDDPTKFVSCFLSYPNGMSIVGEYHWEASIDGEIARFSSEDEAERAILDAIGNAS